MGVCMCVFVCLFVSDKMGKNKQINKNQGNKYKYIKGLCLSSQILKQIFSRFCYLVNLLNFLEKG